jgi:hypothetical protein
MADVSESALRTADPALAVEIGRFFAGCASACDTFDA